MGLTTEHRGTGPKVVVPGTGQFLNSTCIRTNQSRKSIRFRFRFIYLVILQTQETSAKTKSGRCRRGHLEKNKVYSIHVCTNNSNY